MDLTWCVDGMVSGNKCVLVKMDCESSEEWSTLLKRKDGVPQAGLKFLDEIAREGKDPPSFFRMDRAHENQKVAVPIKKKHPKVKMECTANDTLQQNGKVERAMETLWNGVRAMLDDAGLRSTKRK